MELKSRLDARRSELIDQKGIDSLKYIKQLVADNKEVTVLQRDSIKEVTKRFNISEDILENSRNSYIGDTKKSMTKGSINKVLGLFF